MAEFLEILQEPFVIRALVTSTTVGIMCGVFGCFIVLRNMALIGDAMAHSVLPGVVFAFIIWGHNDLMFNIWAAVAGLLTAFAITWIERNTQTKGDSAIGIAFTTMFSIGVIGISRISKGEEGVHLDLEDFLFGNVLTVGDTDLYLSATANLIVLFSVAVFYRYLFATTFQPVIARTMGISVQVVHYFMMFLLALSVVASLQIVGVILVVAMLITPPSTALLLSNRLQQVILISALIGLTSAVLGFCLSYLFNAPPGPAMTVTATLFYLLAVLFAPQKGLLFRTIQRQKLRRKIQIEDTLKQALRLQDKEELNLDKLHNQLGFSMRRLRQHLRTLEVQGFFSNASAKLMLTPKGREEAQRLVRAHRLWETYLVNRIGLNEGQIHEDAEKFEHLLTEEMLDEVDRELGFPTTDPHGSPIPVKRGLPPQSMLQLHIQSQARIAQQQVNERITSQLWKLGLLPDTPFYIRKKETDQIVIMINDKRLSVPSDLARRINVVSEEKD
ncbi:MAG: iron chelate uptake ABC transporter family permease subunit [Bacteroidota bacterium]